MEVEKFSEGHDFLDLTNPQHFINLVPPFLKEAILKIPNSYFLFNEPQLIAEVYKGEPPLDSDYQMRLAFWEEYDSCFKTCKPMRAVRIYEGSCSQPHFHRHVVHDVGRLAFIISQPTNVSNRLKYSFHLAMSEMLKILKQPTPINSKTGTPDGKILDVKYKIFEYLDQRLHGSIIQRQQIDTKNLNVNIDGNKALSEIPQTPDAIDQRLKELEMEFSTISLPSQNLQTFQPQLTSPMEKVVIEAGRVTPEFERKKTER